MQKNPFYLWHISYQNASMYLLGTIHLVPKSFFPLPRSILNPFYTCDYLVCEVDISQHLALPFMPLDSCLGDPKLSYPPGESLYHYFNPKKILKLRNYLHRNNLCSPTLIQHFHKLRPHVIHTIVNDAIYKQSGVDPTRIGIDHMLLNLAKKLGKPILELETLAFQEQLLADCFETTSHSSATPSPPSSTDPSPHTLLKTLKQASNRMKLFSRQGLLTYKHLEKVSHLIPPDHPLLGDRNKAMAQKLDCYLQSDASYFVAIGALHLHGKGNVLERLEQKGYSVRKIV